MKILQSNVQSFRKNKEEISRILNQENYEVAILTETWYKFEEETTRAYNISGYHKVLHSRADGYGGVGIYIRNHYNYQQIQISSQSEQIQIAAVKILRTNTVIAGIYVAPSVTTNEFEADLHAILMQLSMYPKVIFGGDVNCHHIAWGDEKCDSKGTLLMDSINGSNLILMNTGEKTFVPLEVGRRSTAIDISCCSATMFGELNWKVIPETIGGSEHQLIKISGNAKDECTRFYVNHKKINEEITKLSSENIRNIEELKDKIHASYEKNRKRSKYTPKVWWNDNVEEAWHNKMEAIRKFNADSTIENAIMVRKTRAVFLRRKKEGMHQQVEELAASIDPQTSSATIWDKIGRITGKRNNRRVNNPVQEDVQLAEKFFDIHFGRNDVDIEAPMSYGPLCQYNLMDRDMWDRILARKNDKSAPSNDKITYGMLKKLTPDVTNMVIGQINEMFIAGALTHSLKEIRVVAIPKHGKDQSTVEGKRPISLVPTITKITNSAVLERIQSHLHQNNNLPKLSFGFRKNMSTSTCLNFVVNSIKQNKREGLVTATVFIDLSNAYNSVKTDILEEIMYKLRFPRELVTWVVSFMKNRKVTMQVGRQTVSRMVSNGLPQGDVMSPALFNIYTSELHELNNGEVTLVQFADDFSLMVTGRNVEEVRTKTQQVINVFSEQTKRLCFEINPAKTKIVLFHGGNHTFNVKLNGVTVEIVKSHKYLGITIDRFLSFGEHVRTVRQKIDERLKMLKIISSVRHGGHPQTMNMLFTALIRNYVEYGCSILNNACSTNKRTLQVAINSCLRKVTGCSKTTPINTLLAIAAQEPYDIRTKYVAAKEIAKCIAYRNPVFEQLSHLDIDNVDLDKLAYTEKTFLEHVPIFRDISPIIYAELPDTKVTINMSVGMKFKKENVSTRVLKQMVLCLLNGRYRNHAKVYTDASKNNNNCGIGVYIEPGNRRLAWKLKHQTAIMTAEMVAISMAIKEIVKTNLRNVVILTDSLSSCTVLENSQYSEWRSTMIDEILQGCLSRNIEIQWIPSHIDLEGNDIADYLAKKGTEQASLVEHQILLKDAYLYLQQQKEEETNKWYQDYALEKGQKYYAVQQSFPEKPWYYQKQLDNFETRTLNRIMAGHDYSKFWLHKMKIEDDPNCEICDVPETAEHIILHCVRFNIIRMQFSFDCKYKNLTELLKTNDVNTFKEIITFLKQTKSKI